MNKKEWAANYKENVNGARPAKPTMGGAWSAQHPFAARHKNSLSKTSANVSLTEHTMNQNSPTSFASQAGANLCAQTGKHHLPSSRMTPIRSNGMGATTTSFAADDDATPERATLFDPGRSKTSDSDGLRAMIDGNETHSRHSTGRREASCSKRAVLLESTNKQSIKRQRVEVSGSQSNKFLTTTATTTTTKWTFGEDAILRAAVDQHGSTENWKLIASKLRNHSAAQCQKRWQLVLKPALLVSQRSHHPVANIDHDSVQPSPVKRRSHRKWTMQEDMALKKAIDKFGKQNWERVSSVLPGRSAAECHIHWKVDLKNPWTKEEDRIFLQYLVANGIPGKTGFRWRGLVSLLPGRSVEEFKYHWRYWIEPKINQFVARRNRATVPSTPYIEVRYQDISRRPRLGETGFGSHNAAAAHASTPCNMVSADYGSFVGNQNQVRESDSNVDAESLILPSPTETNSSAAGAWAPL